MQVCKILFIAFVISIIKGNATAAAALKDFNVSLLTNEIDAWIKTGVKSRQTITEALTLPTELQRTNHKNFIKKGNINICEICQYLYNTITLLIEHGMSVIIIKDAIVDLCVKLNLEIESVCRGFIELNAPIILYIINAKPNLRGSYVCGVVLQSESCSTSDNKYEWSVSVNNDTPKLIIPKATNETIKILHISDIHYDPTYEPRGNADCGEPTCCRKGQNLTNTNNTIAGYWGDYNCDSPWHAIVDAFDHIKDNQKNISYVYFTGDIIDHGVWETSRTTNAQNIINTYAKIRETFQDIPVYPILGNHEPSPMNVFAPSNITDEALSTEWLYDIVANIWIDAGWLPESTRSTIRKGGFYTVSPKNGFRIIALNNNICYTYNWWLLYQPQDPDDQLKWLAETLLQAEKNEEYVHILAHIPPGDNSCEYTWSKEYRRIINRFAHIITAQFNGHTHNDELRVFYDLENITKIINVAWNGGSITTYTHLNPNYKMYTVNADTLAVEDIDTWIYNLTLANETPNQRPNWYKEYSFKEEYSLEDLSLISLSNWIYTMATNNTILHTYYKNYVKHADPALKFGCDASCLQSYLCQIVTSVANDNTQCDYFDSF